MKKLLFVISMAFLLLSCNWEEDKAKKIEEKHTELDVDINNIAGKNNATDSQLYNDHRYERAGGNGLDKYSFPEIMFNLEEGLRCSLLHTGSRYGPCTYWSDFSYFVLRERNGDYYLIDYKIRFADTDQWDYSYRCFKYYVSDRYLKFEKSDEIFEDVFDYVNPK